MDRNEISRIAHRDHPIAAPVARESLRTLLARLSPPEGARVVDLGCGWGEWLIELLSARGDLTGVGVDISLPDDLADRARARGVAERVSWVEANASTWNGGEFDVVMCVGASHAFGGLTETLDGIRRFLRPGGSVLLGDTIWDTPPSSAAVAAFGTGSDEVPDLLGLIDITCEKGFEPGYGHVSTIQEWDEYEWSWTGSLTAWAMRHAQNDAERDQALGAAREHRDAWLSGYRGQLGFATLVLYELDR